MQRLIAGVVRGLKRLHNKNAKQYITSKQGKDKEKAYITTESDGKKQEHAYIVGDVAIKDKTSNQ